MKTSFQINEFEKYFILAIIFLSGFDYMVPVYSFISSNSNVVDFPFWAKKMEIVHGIFLRDFIFSIYLLIQFFKKSISTILKDKVALKYFFFITLLCFVGVVSTIVNQQTLFDIFESLRIGFLAIFFLACFYWSNKFGANVVLRTFLFGALVSMSINLYFSFQISWSKIGILPLLLGQNGPGGATGFMIGLSAYLFLIRKVYLDIIIASLFSIIGCFTVLISYSKLGMIMSAFGLIAWLTVILNYFWMKKTFKVFLISLSVLIMLSSWMIHTDIGKDFYESAEKFYYYKLGDDKLIDYNDGDEERIYYFKSVLEILVSNPFFGVSYYGFQNAINKTMAHKSTGLLADELNPNSANPHNAFLYYISANGIPGLIIVNILFFGFIRILYESLKIYKKTGIIVWFCLFAAIMIHGNTLPTLFNTDIMYFPAAISFSLYRNIKRINT